MENTSPPSALYLFPWPMLWHSSKAPKVREWATWLSWGMGAGHPRHREPEMDNWMSLSNLQIYPISLLLDILTPLRTSYIRSLIKRGQFILWLWAKKKWHTYLSLPPVPRYQPFLPSGQMWPAHDAMLIAMSGPRSPSSLSWGELEKDCVLGHHPTATAPGCCFPSSSWPLRDASPHWLPCSQAL